jgi:hypothetical protein
MSACQNFHAGDRYRRALYTVKTTPSKRNNMAKRSIEERLAQLDAQRKTLQARLGKQERARDTRRKVLLGALVLHRIAAVQEKGENAGWLTQWIKRELPEFLTHDNDKALFADLLRTRLEEPHPSKTDT